MHGVIARFPTITSPDSSKKLLKDIVIALRVYDDWSVGDKEQLIYNKLPTSCFA
jgi:hypothetical protein